jgi:hypothetical protein
MPPIARTAGTNVRATSRATSTATAMPGPNALKNDNCATTRQLLATITVRPANRIVGRSVAVVTLAASGLERPAARSERNRDSRNTQ